MKVGESKTTKSVVNGGQPKRRANSNHSNEKKLNLDKFLNIVQQRTNNISQHRNTKNLTELQCLPKPEMNFATISKNVERRKVSSS